MSAKASSQKRPRSWPELRARALEQDYMAVDEMKRRKLRAHQMKYGLWAAAFIVALLIPVVIAEGLSWYIAVAIALIAYGAIASYRIGAVWERRWEELIREKSAR